MSNKTNSTDVEIYENVEKKIISKSVVQNDEVKYISQSNTILLRVATTNTLKYDKIQLFNPEKNTYLTLVENIQTEMQWSSTAVIGSVFIFIGGLIDDVVTKKAFGINLLSNCLITMPNMKEERRECACAVVDEELYVIGGMDEFDQSLQTIEMWDSSNTWKNKRNMNKERHSHCAVVFSGKIYVFGGYDNDKNYLKSFEVYDPKTNEWKINTDRKDIRGIDTWNCPRTLGTVYNNHIYIYEPYKELPEYEPQICIFHPETDTFTYLCEPPWPFDNLITFENKVIYFGNCKNYGFDTEARDWIDYKNQETAGENCILSVPSSCLNQATGFQITKKEVENS